MLRAPTGRGRIFVLAQEPSRERTVTQCASRYLGDEAQRTTVGRRLISYGSVP
jgi:hypothetical protein